MMELTLPLCALERMRDFIVEPLPGPSIYYFIHGNIKSAISQFTNMKKI